MTCWGEISLAHNGNEARDKPRSIIVKQLQKLFGSNAVDKIFKCSRARKKKKKSFSVTILHLKTVKFNMEKIIVEGLCGKGVSWKLFTDGKIILTMVEWSKMCAIKSKWWPLSHMPFAAPLCACVTVPALLLCFFIFQQPFWHPSWSLPALPSLIPSLASWWREPVFSPYVLDPEHVNTVTYSRLLCAPVLCGDQLWVSATAQIHHAGARITSVQTAPFLSEPPKHQMPALIKEDDCSTCLQLLSFLISTRMFQRAGEALQCMDPVLQQRWERDGKGTSTSFLETSLP